MDIEKLTVGELMQIGKLAARITDSWPQEPAVTVAHPFVGKYVICRCYSAGVHAGYLVNVNGEQVILKNSRRLWYWKAKDGLALSGVAQNGLGHGCKIDTLNPEIALTGVCEIIPCSSQAQESIHDYVS